MKIVNHKMTVRAGGALLMLCALTACGEKSASKSGQALARIDGEEVTVSQLNEELQRAGVQPAQQQAASKQLLSSLVDRQLLLNAAAKEKLERDPRVVQEIERAKAVIIAQSYLQKRAGQPTKPTDAQIGEYFDKNPQFFTERKQFDMRQVQLATASLNDEVKAVIDKSTSLDEVTAWLDSHQVKYVRGQVSRTSADLPPELSSRLLTMGKQLFIVREGERSVLSQIVAVKEAPLTLAQATPQITQFLINKKNKEVAEGELVRLRAAAKIEYLNQAMQPDAPKAQPAPAASTPDSTARGVAGLK